jgi:hypothetical protein
MMDQMAVRAEPLAPHRNQYELKFALSPVQANAFLEATAPWLVTKVYDESLPIAFARTTYLDSPDRRYLASSSERVSRRLRIREYAGAPALDAPVRLTGISYLEYKESSGGRRRKARLAMSTDDIAEILRQPDEAVITACLDRYGDEGAVQVLAQELIAHRLTPQLTTWYRRRSLVDAPEEVRITLDTEIAFCRPLGFDGDHRGAPMPAIVTGYSGTCLLEVKYEGEPPRWLASAVDALGKPDRLSKYAMGMRALETAIRGTGELPAR